MKIKLFVARKIQFFELGILSFNSYVYYLTRGFIASIPAFHLLARAFNLGTRAFSVRTREFELVTRGFELVTLEFKLVTRGFELAPRRFELVTRGFQLVTRVLLFHSAIFGNGTLTTNNVIDCDSLILSLVGIRKCSYKK